MGVEETADATGATSEEGEGAETEETTDETQEGAEDTAAEGGEGASAEGEETEGEEKPHAAAVDWSKALAEAPEADLKKLGERFANRTMAAARRSEARTEAVQRENATLKTRVAEHEAAAKEWQENPHAAMRRLGFAKVRDFLDHLAGKEAKEPTEADRLSDIEKRIKDREEREEQAQREANVATARKNVANHIAGDPKRWALVAKPTGQTRLWDEIVGYHKQHGQVPLKAINRLADLVEADMRAEFGVPATIASGQSQPAKNGTTAAPSGKGATTDGNGKPTVRTNAKAGTIAARGAGAPVVREYPDDPDAHRKQVEAELRAEGLL